MMAERDEPTGALVRPYAVTRGRTRPKLEIAIEALVETTVRGRAANTRPGGAHGPLEAAATACRISRFSPSALRRTATVRR